MWVQAAALLLACQHICPTLSLGTRQSGSIWDDPITFKTKAKDSCSMSVTGQGDSTRLRVSCRAAAAADRSYWCDFVGRPHTCSAYNKRPRHYFVQMMWYLRKLPNACEGKRRFKPFMCRKATNDSQMVFSSSSSTPRAPQQQQQQQQRGHHPPLQAASRPANPPQPPRPRPTPPRHIIRKLFRPQTRGRPTRRPPATKAPQQSAAKRAAQQYCWRSLQGLCSFFIGVFRS